ncbi:hypothetical protein K469DRAFT_731431 [Zopfia rhizophila CBS 207.26]|uniref:Uncharacterized protein n=1 Tax=Zopfia rhizophila CBS 207.26 TaxID=1314779 RepID=A0A6A6DKR8_9PEZI|nr:hypothetical protein K469DRAFT_731431 [Zopfia rhizophila CBS 207.26]
MIVRESPKSGVKREPRNWPPKSPREALLSSPSGRRKYERQRERDSVSPSPSKRRPMSRGQLEDEEEDEETLELQLKAIEARLKLKRLQQVKARQATEDGDNNSIQTSSRPGTAAGSRRPELPRPQSAVQVPVSPVKNRRAPEEHKSPARVLLGIDKGLRAQDVSLKRAASYHARSNTRDASGSLSRTKATRGGAETPRVKSFSERIAESRNKEKEREEKQVRIAESRSTRFGLNNIEGLRSGASSRAGSSLSTGTRVSQEMPPPARKGSDLLKSRSIGDLRATSTPRPSSNLSARSDASQAPSTSTVSSRTSSSTLRTATTSKTSIESPSTHEENSEPSIFESFSGLHLNKREVPHNALTRTMDGKSIFTIPQLLKIVKSPTYDPPDVENDFVVMGVIASKSSPLNTKNSRRDQSTGKLDDDANQSSGKFMVIRLTDLKWELDLYLFDTGFSQFWKLSVGTLIAVLNPDIMPPRNRDTGKFSLKLTSSDDTVLEIGTARDLDFCHARRKDGKDCLQWIDGRKTEYCDFHVELAIEKSKRGRIEIATMAGVGKGPGVGRLGMFGGGGRGQGVRDDGLKREGRFHDRSIHETVYIAPRAGAAAKLLDEADDWNGGASRAELHRKRMAEKEKERELAKRLGEIGKGTGSDYMRMKGAATPCPPARDEPRVIEAPSTTQEKVDSLEDPLGLLRKKADDVSLSPVKRKRIASGKSTAGSNEPVGWSGAFKRGLLLSPKKDNKQTTLDKQFTRESSPAKKKARLLLPEKGIREPGRDSLGGLDVGLLAAMDDDDDDLDIV